MFVTVVPTVAWFSYSTTAMALARAGGAVRWWMMALMVAIILVGEVSSKSFDSDDDDADEWSLFSDPNA